MVTRSHKTGHKCSQKHDSPWASLMAQWVKNPPAVQETQETWVQSLGWEDPLEKEMATHSSILAWEIPWTEEPGGLQSMESQRVGHDLVTKQHYPLTLGPSTLRFLVMSDI